TPSPPLRVPASRPAGLAAWPPKGLAAGMAAQPFSPTPRTFWAVLPRRVTGFYASSISSMTLPPSWRWMSSMPVRPPAGVAGPPPVPGPLPVPGSPVSSLAAPAPGPALRPGAGRAEEEGPGDSDASGAGDGLGAGAPLPGAGAWLAGLSPVGAGASLAGIW